MIVALLGYGLIVGALAAIAAWLVERAQVVLGRPRKHAWMGGMVAALLVPALVMAFGETGEGVVSRLATTMQNQVQGVAGLSVVALPVASPGGEADRGALNAWLAALWAVTSGLLLLAYAFSAWRLARRARTWPVSRVDAQPVRVAPDIGPAVYGLIRSQVVFPRWLTDAPQDVQRLALAHEREHLAARDSQILCLATLLCALLPWNLPLLWMQRRLRFAMEVDCDARVIGRGADPNEYGLALLYVSERQSRAPITAIALIERKSQLERRINFMFATPRKSPAVIAGICFALATYCLAGAAQLPAPDLDTAKVVLKPPPGADGPAVRLGQAFETLLRERYPELLQGNFTDTPVLVVLLNDDMTVANSAQIASIPPDGKLNGTPDHFAAIGLTPEQVPMAGMTSMRISPQSSKSVVVMYTERGTRDANFVSRLHPDTRKLDREFFAQEFPGATSRVAADSNHWVLLDRSGAVLRKGIEPTRSSSELTEALEKRFEGIDTQEVFVTHITDESGQNLRDAAGKDLHLWSVWLAPGSRPPAD